MFLLVGYSGDDLCGVSCVRDYISASDGFSSSLRFGIRGSFIVFGSGFIVSA